MWTLSIWKNLTVLGPGDVYLAPPAVWHGESVFIGDDELNEVWILDVFAPPRSVKPSAPREVTAS